MDILNRYRLQEVLNEYDFNNPCSNTEELAGFLDSRGVIIPPCAIGAEVWAYVLSGLNKCKVTNISYDFLKNEWLIIVSCGGFPYGVKRVYSSREAAELFK